MRRSLALSVLTVLAVTAAASAPADTDFRAQRGQQPGSELLTPSRVEGLVQLDPQNPEGFREVLLTWIAVLETRQPGLADQARARDLYDQVERMDAGQLQAMSRRLPDAEGFRNAVRRAADSVLAFRQRFGFRGEFLRRIKTGRTQSASSAPYSANYPSGSIYDPVILTPLIALGNLTDDGGVTAPDPDGEVRDERCNDDGFAALYAIVESLTIAAQTAAGLCELDPTGICSAVVAIAQAAIDVAALDLKLCELHGGNVDSAEIEATYENVLAISELLECDAAAGSRKTHGCNGNDDDCDGSVDECDEDRFGPDLFIHPMVRNVWYGSAAEAVAAVEGAIVAIDPCQTVTISPVTLSGTCDDVVATVVATDGCGNVSTATVPIKIDDGMPLASCSVATDSLWPANHQMVDVGFTRAVNDDCGNAEIEVSVRSDEPTASASGAGQTSPAPDAEILRTLDGEIHGIRLRAERSSSGNGRVYEITVTATDAAGNHSSGSCRVDVPSSRGQNGTAVNDGQYYDATAVN